MNKINAHQQTGANQHLFYGYIIVMAALAIRMAMVSPRYSFGVFFKPILNDFTWSRALISGAYSASSIAQALSGIVMGGLNDRLGPRVVVTVCGLLVGLGLLLMSRINAAWQLYLFYILIIGVGMGGSFTPPMSTVARWFIKKRSMMTGIVSAGAGIAGLIVPPIVNWIISTYGWRTTYIIMCAPVLAIIIVGAQLLRRDPSKVGQVPYGYNDGKEPGLRPVIEGLLLKEAVCTRQFWIAVTIFFCAGFSLSTITVHIVPHVTDLAISTTTAANILAITSGAFLAGGILLGAFADRAGNRQAYVVSFILMVAALSWLLTNRDVWIFYLLAVVFGFGGGGVNTLESPLVAELFGIKSHGLILGLCSIFFLTGSAAGPFLAGYIFDTTGNYRLAFIICAVTCTLGILLALVLRPIIKPKI